MDEPKKKILIIEDDANLLMVYKTKFESEGFTVFDALTGSQGLTLAKDNKPDIILLDIMLPEGMNGFDVLQQLKLISELKEVPVILLTNLDSEKDSGLSMGAVDYVVKADTSIDELLSKVKSHIH